MENLYSVSVIKDLCERYGFSFSKSLGQNFIINKDICPKIASMGNAESDKGIIEIGTGFGVLTTELAKRAKKVVAIEIDKKLMPVLDETLSEFSNVKIINDDVLNVDLNKLIADEFNGMDVSVCANLPYYITSPIIMKLLEDKLPIKAITVMVQKEAAQRLCAQMGSRDCGAVTAAVRYYSEPKLLFNVTRGSFMPPPNVDSSVIRLDVTKNDFGVKDDKVFFKLVKAAFSQRRKTLANPVSAAFGIKKQELLEILDGLDIKRTARAEELTMEQFALLANELCNKE